VVGRRLTGEHENTRTDHRTDAQKDQMLGRESPFQRGFAIQAAFDGFASVYVTGWRNRLDPQQSFKHAINPEWLGWVVKRCHRHLCREGHAKPGPTLAKAEGQAQDARATFHGDNGRTFS